MKELLVYVHGKGGSADEAEQYRTLFEKGDVIGFDYQAQNPWEAQEEFRNYFDAQRKGYDAVILLANSIGAFFSMSALSEAQIDRALFISPVVNMERLIRDMMTWAKVSESDLRNRGEIPTEFGETLSWKYLCYVREHPLSWEIPTCILYGEKDHLTSIETVSEFANRIGASLTVMKNGEHWFHTDEQMGFLGNWMKKMIR